MKWLVLQSNRKIGPYGPEDSEFLRECWAMKYALEQNNQDVDVWGLRHDNFNNRPDFNKYDFIYIDEQYEFDWIPWIEIGTSKAHKLHRWTDISVHENYYRFVPFINTILSPSKLKIPEIQNRSGLNVIWHPSGMDGRYFKPTGIPKMLDAIWLGTHTRKYIKQLNEEIGLPFGTTAGQNYINTLSAAKVFVNSREWGEGDIPYKNFECIGVGTCVICDYDKHYEELGFENNVNCMFFNSYETCRDTILYLLDSGEWERIGNKGLELSPYHTYESRMGRLIKILDGKLDATSFVMEK